MRLCEQLYWHTLYMFPGLFLLFILSAGGVSRARNKTWERCRIYCLVASISCGDNFFPFLTENLEYNSEPREIPHPDIGRYFSEFTGIHYLANTELEIRYPEDMDLTRVTVQMIYSSGKEWVQRASWSQKQLECSFTLFAKLAWKASLATILRLNALKTALNFVTGAIASFHCLPARPKGTGTHW